MRKQSTVYSYPVAHTMNEETFYTVIRLPIPFMRKRCTFIMLPIPYMRKMHVGKFYTIILLSVAFTLHEEALEACLHSSELFTMRDVGVEPRTVAPLPYL